MDSTRLAENVGALLNDKQLRERLVDQAEAFVRNFSKEQTSEKTLKVYQDVLAEQL
jgi:glycosyltransferase involved in cell wall biosynthesis